jgi:hypothetical protein
MMGVRGAIVAQAHMVVCAVDEMGGRLDELEKSISDLVQQAGVEGSPAAAPAAGQNATQPAAPQPAKEG